MTCLLLKDSDKEEMVRQQTPEKNNLNIKRYCENESWLLKKIRIKKNYLVEN